MTSFFKLMAKATKRLTVDLNDCLNKNPIEGMSIETIDNNLFNWSIKMDGPQGTPYEGKILNVKIVFPEEYPHKEFSIFFNPPIYHPNVDPKTGIPCLKILQPWSPSLKMYKILADLREMVINPDPSHAVEYEIGKEYAENRQEFNRKATEWMQKYF